MQDEGITRVLQDRIAEWEFSLTDDLPFDEAFAVKRYLKKMEVPDRSSNVRRKQKCFDEYLTFDKGLIEPAGFVPRRWYKARSAIHKIVGSFRLAPLSLTTGSEVSPTFGLNSIEAKLCRSKWECTPDCFELWAKLAYQCAAVKRATRRRLAKVFDYDSREIRRFHVRIWKASCKQRDRKFFCFKKSLALVTGVYHASRFSTVPKNNDTDRPIALEGMANMCVQRSIGTGLRNLLRDSLGVDLDELAEKHRRLIKDKSLATIDLKNASDGVSLWLIRFLFPKWFYDLLIASRPPFLEGPDGHYYMLKKVSSMGCGYTFELMSLVLHCVGIESSDRFSVFGDDIIVPVREAQGVISDLEGVGFVVNKEKSFIGGKFRESCGANWHDDYGYIKSFDFTYPESISDCIVTCNKALLLGKRYPQFKRFWEYLMPAVPPALQGPDDLEITGSHGRRTRDEDVRLAEYFRCPKPGVGCGLHDPRVNATLQELHLGLEPLRGFYGFKWVPKLANRQRTELVMRLHYAKYAMYLHGGKRVPNEITGRGKWQRIVWVQVGQRAFRAKSLASQQR